MTTMKRITVSLPNELDQAIIDLRKTKRFERCTYSEVARIVLEKGISTLRNHTPA